MLCLESANLEQRSGPDLAPPEDVLLYNFLTVNMTEEERDYHYFRLHDFDNNDLLDGLEVFKALIHEHEDGNNQDTGNDGVKKSFDDIVEMIDQVRKVWFSFYQLMQWISGARGR